MASPAPKVLFDSPPSRRPAAFSPVAGGPEMAWRWLGRFGFVLALVGFGDVALTWYPLNFGSPEWEFGTVAFSFAALPVVTLGLALLFASALARGARWLLLATAVSAVLIGLLVAAAFVLFLTDVPVALRLQGAPAEAVLGLHKAILKTSLLGVGFSTTYLLAGVFGLRHFQSTRRNR